MPTYEYRCKECDDQFEIVQAFSDDALTECTKCDGKLKKVYGNVGISFKGSGFYKNDARGKTSSTTAAPAASSDTKSEAKTDKSSESKKETKPAKSETKPAKSAASSSASKSD